jgi:hypothetical protein
VTISYSSGVYTLSTSGSYTPADLYAHSAAGINRHTGSRIIYDFGSSRIIVGSGTTLTIDTDTTYGEIMFSDPGWNNSTFLHHIKVNSGGTLIVGSETTRDLCIWCKDDPSLGYLDQNRNFYIEGTFNWLGGGIAGNTPSLQAYSGSSGIISGPAFSYAPPGSTGSITIRLSDTDFVIESLAIAYGAVIPFVYYPNGVNGLTFYDMPAVEGVQATVGLDNDGVTAQFLICKDWDISSPTIDKAFGFWDQRWARFINQASGTDFISLGNLNNNSNNRGLAEVRQEITFSATNGGGAKFYTEDTNNGSRLAANQLANNPNYLTDRTYTATESGGSASYTTDGGVLTGVHWRTVGGLSASNNQFDSRGLNNDKTDVFTWLKVEYGQQPATANIIMKGKGGVFTEIPSLTDLGITQATKATVAAYTGIALNYSGGTLTATITENHSWNEVYDYIKWYESENPDDVWANSKASFVSTSNKLDYSASNLAIVVDNADLTAGAGQTIPVTVTVQNDGFVEDATGAKWEDGGAIYYASPISHTIKVGATPIENAELAYFDSGNNNRTYNTSRVSVTSLTSNASGVVSGYSVYQIDASDYSAQDLRVREYSYNAISIPTTLDGSSISTDVLMNANPFVTDTKVNVAAYTGIAIVFGTETVTVTVDQTHTKVFDYAQYTFALAANLDETVLPIDTADGTNHLYATDWSLVVDGANVELDEEAVEVDTQGTGTISITNGAFFEDSTNVIWEDSGDTYYASHAWIKVVDGVSSLGIEDAAIGWGDEATQTKLMYDLTLTQTGLETDTNGEAEGYCVYKINSTTYAQTKMVIGEYDYQFLTIPRTLVGTPIGTEASPEINRLSSDSQVTKTKANALLVSGITITHASKLVDIGDNTLPDSYDYIKAVQASIADIEPGIPGCLSYCIYGQLLSKSSTNFTAISDWLYQNVGDSGKFIDGTIEFDTPGTINRLYDSVDFDFSTAGTYDFRSSTIDGTIDLTNSSGGNVTVKLNPATSFTNTGPNITVESSVAVVISALNLIDDTRVQLYNVTQDAEISNEIVSGGSGYTYNATLGPGEEVEDGDQVRLRAAYTSGTSAKGEVLANGVVTESGLSFIDSQSDDPIYNLYAIDGSTVTKFAADYVDTEIDLVVASDFTAQEMYAWWTYNTTTENGIRNFFGAITAEDSANIRVNNSLVDVQFDNDTATNLIQTDNVRLYRSDEVYPVKNPPTGGGGIDVVWRSKVFIAETGVSGLTPTEAAQLALIEDALTRNQFLALK